MRPFQEPIAVTGLGVVCNLGDELDPITDHLLAGSQGRFVVEPVAEQHKARCLLVARYAGDLGDEALGLDRKASRFMGRASRLALKASRAALGTSGVGPDALAWKDVRSVKTKEPPTESAVLQLLETCLRIVATCAALEEGDQSNILTGTPHAWWLWRSLRSTFPR